MRAVLATNLAPPAAYPGYLDPYPLAPPNKPTNVGLDLLVLVGSDNNVHHCRIVDLALFASRSVVAQRPLLGPALLVAPFGNSS